MQTLRRTAAILIWPTIAWLGACDQADAPTAPLFGVVDGQGPGKATGGGQIDILDDVTGETIGKATFGFNGKQAETVGGVAGAVSGHLNYVNHVTGVHLNCEVESGGVTPAMGTTPASGEFVGYECTPSSTFSNFRFRIVDRDEPGRDDTFTISYVDNQGATIMDGGPIIRSGNIQVH